ncbi:MAG: LiaF domain-containing protein [Bacillota bacterium]|nr:cell wall-active antibiotics response protein [Candidatus Fermentithermobacillaceae bacterium]
MASRLLNGLVLVVVGAILLMNTSGYLPWSVWDAAVSFWPFLVIGLGLQLVFSKWKVPWFAIAIVVILILGAMFPNHGLRGPIWRSDGIRWEFRVPWKPMEHTEDYSVPLGPTISRLKMELGAPSLELEARGDSGLNNVAMPVLMTGSLSWDRHEPSKSWEEAGGETRVSIRAPDRTGVDAGKQTWDITLNPSIATSIKVTGGVANVSLDCRSVDLGDLNISAGVVDLDLEFGLSGKETRVMISGGAATVDVTVPRAAGLRVSISSPLTITHDLGAQGMTRSGNAWVTPDYESASTKIDLVVSCGAGKIKVSRTE